MKASGRESLRTQAREGIIVGVWTQEGIGFRMQREELASQRKRNTSSIKLQGRKLCWSAGNTGNKGISHLAP